MACGSLKLMLWMEFRDPVGLHDSPQLQVSFHSSVIPLDPLVQARSQVNAPCSPGCMWESAPSRSPRRPMEDKEGRLGQAHLGPLVLHFSFHLLSSRKPMEGFLSSHSDLPQALTYGKTKVESTQCSLFVWIFIIDLRLRMSNGLCF